MWIFSIFRNPLWQETPYLSVLNKTRHLTSSSTSRNRLINIFQQFMTFYRPNNISPKQENDWRITMVLYRWNFPFPLPSFRFDLGAGDAGDPGDRPMASGFVGVVNLRSASFLAGDSILRVLSILGGLLSPSGSGLVGFVFRSERGAGRRDRQRIKTSE